MLKKNRTPYSRLLLCYLAVLASLNFALLTSCSKDEEKVEEQVAAAEPAAEGAAEEAAKTAEEIKDHASDAVASAEPEPEAVPTAEEDDAAAEAAANTPMEAQPDPAPTSPAVQPDPAPTSPAVAETVPEGRVVQFVKVPSANVFASASNSAKVITALEKGETIVVTVNGKWGMLDNGYYVPMSALTSRPVGYQRKKQGWHK